LSGGRKDVGKLWLLFVWEVKARTQVITFIAMLALYAFLFQLNIGPGPRGPSLSGAAVQTLMNVFFNVVVDLFLLLVPVSAVLATFSIAYEVDTGVSKLFLSLPLKRSTVFISKIMSMITMLFLPFIVAFLGFVVNLDPTLSHIPYVFADRRIYFALMICILQMLFVLSIAILSASLVNQTMLAPLPSIIVFFFIYYIGSMLPRAGNYYIPPFSLQNALSELSLPFAEHSAQVFTSLIILSFITLAAFVASFYAYVNKEVP
jgi:ABC-type transport system involved in multi-copper enzyme maturation permease subunit